MDNIDEFWEKIKQLDMSGEFKHMHKKEPPEKKFKFNKNNLRIICSKCIPNIYSGWGYNELSSKMITIKCKHGYQIPKYRGHSFY